MSRRIIFEANAFADFNDWLKRDRKLHRKIIALIKDIERSPFSGLGKPEPLKHGLSGYWSRRIDSEHRLVYKVTESTLFCHFRQRKMRIVPKKVVKTPRI